ncbi:internal head protein [Pseudomonas phage PhiPA3]|uniref:Virion structural protein n=1 Tax=Pseudomonas phage PhiPA3 TaxID=998086 RepID=F8SK56_BPPA3|nr:internal head protein [Pseudomonas phage PhiPA3]AEH03609.1 virion structural protein [Pseudomonas phage PhiPA3]
MARVKLFQMINAISMEDVEKANDANVEVEGKKDLEPQLKGDEGEKPNADDVDAAVTNTQTTEPGPSEGGGDGTAQTVDVNHVESSDKVENHVKPVDQANNGEGDDAPEKVNADDDNVATTTSVEEHDNDGLQTIESGETECVGEADDLVMDIEEVTNDVDASGITEAIDSKSDAVQGIVEEIREMENVEAAVESYLGVLRGMRNRGTEISPELQETMRIGLEAMDSTFFKGSVVSVEDIDDGEGHKTARDATESKLSAKAKQIWEALKRAFMRALAALQDVFVSVMNNAGKLKERLGKLRSEVNVLEGGKEVKVANAMGLSMNGEWVGDSDQGLKNIRRTADEALLNFPSKLADGLVALNRRYRDKTQEGIEAYEEAINSVIKIYNQSFTSFKSSNARGEITDIDTSRYNRILLGPVMPGNRVLAVAFSSTKTESGGSAVGDTEAKNLTSVIKEKLATLNSEAYSGTVKTPSASEARAVVAALEGIVDSVLARNEGRTSLKKLANMVQGIAQNRNENPSAMAKTQGGHWVDQIAISVARRALETNHELIAYIMRTIKTYIGFLEASIKAEAGGETINQTA